MSETTAKPKVRWAGITFRQPGGTTTILGWNGIDEIVEALEARDTEESKNLLRLLREGDYHNNLSKHEADAEYQLRGYDA